MDSAVSQEVGKQPMALFAQDAFGMKLHPFQGQRLVAQPPDLANAAILMLAPGRHGQAIRQCLRLDHE